MTTVTQFAGEAAVAVRCWCSISFAVPRTLYDYYERANEGGKYTLFCPLGHSMIPAGLTAAQREANNLRDQLAREKHRAEQAQEDARRNREWAHRAERQVAAKKGQITKIKNRVSSGVCPCCTRYFANLHRHMQGQHPEWAPENDDTATDVTPRHAQAVTKLLKVTGTRENWREMSNRRRTLGISVADAAKAIGLKATSLRGYESGSTHSMAAALRLAAFLNEKVAK